MINAQYNSKTYKLARSAYKAQSTFDYFITILAADAFLAKLLTYIGISDALIGIISSFITIAFVFQLLSLILVNKMTNTKKTVLIFDSIGRLFFILIYFVPFLNVPKEIKTAIVIVSILAAYVGQYLIGSIIYKWCNSFVDPNKRGIYSATREIISLALGIVFTLVVGYVFDRYEAMGNVTDSFLFIAILMIVLSICNFVSFLLIKNERVEKAHTAGIKEILSGTLGNKRFVNVVILAILWEVAKYITVGFLGVYKTNDLLMSLGTIQIINMFANLSRLAVSAPVGMYSDKTSFAKGFRLGLVFAAIGFFFNIFATPDRIWCIVVYSIFYACSFAGTNLNSFNITYSYVESDYIVHAIAIKNCIGGIFGFGASLVGGKILSTVQANGNMVFGRQIYGQQILSAISVGVILIAIVFTKLIIEKQPTIKQ